MKKIIFSIIRTQHKFLSIPLPIWKFIFSFKPIMHVFYFYGLECFHCDYYSKYKEDSGYLDYWTSERALYWHFLHQSSTDATDNFKTVFNTFPNIFNKNLDAVEIGFAVGRVFNQSPNIYKFKNFKAIEPNKYCCKIAVVNFFVSS